MGSIGPQKSGRVTHDGAFIRRRGPGEGSLFDGKIAEVAVQGGYS